MTRLKAVLLVLLAIVILAGCKDLPGSDGRYATHDRGQNNRGSP
jgi:PBP1b-binding outer membrane lipoprotein LpoB